MKFTDTHEWIDVQNGMGTVGITPYAEKELGEIVYIELPQVGAILNAHEQACVLESTKAAADVYTPVSGEIVEVNQLLKEDSNLVNRSAQTEGWLFKIRLKNLEELEKLMDEAAYLRMINPAS